MNPIMKPSMKYYGVLLGAILVATLVAIGISSFREVPEAKEQASTTQGKSEEWTTYTLARPGIRFDLPKSVVNASIQDSIIPTDTEYTTFYSTEKAHWVDPVSGQSLSDSLFSFTVLSHAEGVTFHDLHEWISRSSATEGEQERTRADRGGYMGVRQWIQHTQNPSHFSSLSYYLLIDDVVWEFRFWLNNDEPRSSEFLRVRELAERTFDSVRFTQ